LSPTQTYEQIVNTDVIPVAMRLTHLAVNDTTLFGQTKTRNYSNLSRDLKYCWFFRKCRLDTFKNFTVRGFDAHDCECNSC